MLTMDNKKLLAPNAEGNIWKDQICPAFTRRKNAPLVDQCWCCVFADFHLDQPRPLDVGVCYYPKKVLE